ncbi:MAG: Rieske 2Fe-2S domain-containing protein [Aquabacterium sp.]
MQPAELFRGDAVHRDAYISPAVFACEMQRLWARSWLYAAHASQIPAAGDFVAVTLGSQPSLVVRQEDGSVAVIANRCAHKGAPITTEPAGRFDRALRCPYHGWAYRLDGRLIGQPLPAGYAGTGFGSCEAAAGLDRHAGVAQHRGFIFARRRAQGPDFDSWAGELKSALDLLADRSPQGELRLAGGVLRTTIRANWKIVLENINDAVHPVTAHRSAADAAQAIWQPVAPGQPTPPALQQLLPFGSGYGFFEQMGGRLLPHGHTVLGTQHSIHSAYDAIPGYADALAAAHGPTRTRAVLGFVPQNVVFYPSMALKGAPQVMRVLRPLAADRTVLEAWAFEAVGAPDELLRQALGYNRMAFSPASIIAADDLHIFEAMQQALAADGNAWVSLHRDARGAGATVPRDVSGVDEALLRHAYAAWAAALSMPDPAGPA